MTCHNCVIECKKAGKRADGQQRYRCAQCGKTFSDRTQFGVVGHKQIDDKKALLALQLLVEGNKLADNQPHHWAGPQHDPEAFGVGR